MKKLLTLALALAASVAFANGDDPCKYNPKSCQPPVQTPAPDGLKLTLQLGMGMGQSADVDSNSKSESNSYAKGGSVDGNIFKGGDGGAAVAGLVDSGNSKSTSASGVTGSGNSTAKVGDQTLNGKQKQQQSTDASSQNVLNVDASDRGSYTDNSKVMFIPAIVPATPASTVGNSQILKETTACGPLQKVVKTPIAGTFYGIFGTDKTEQGYTYELAPYEGKDGEFQPYHEYDTPDGKVFFGHQVIEKTALVNVANSRNIALGGGNSSGSWGQGGTGTSAANNQMVTTITLRLCEAGRSGQKPATQPKKTLEDLPVVTRTGE